MSSTPSNPFPYAAIFALCMSLTCNCYVVTSLFPYIGYMILHLGATESKDEVGYYAGFVAGSLMLGRFISSFYWGHWSDQHGRKPVLYIGLVSIIIFSTLFGLSTSFWCALLWRFLLGSLNSILSATRVSVSEVCGKEHEVKGMGVITGCWSIGYVIGPALGGLLADPSSQYPSLFGDIELFKKFPYLMANLVSSLFAIISLFLVAAFVPETAGKLSSSHDSSPEGSTLLNKLELGENNQESSSIYKAVHEDSHSKSSLLRKNSEQEVLYFHGKKESLLYNHKKINQCAHDNEQSEHESRSRFSSEHSSMWESFHVLTSNPVVRKILTIFLLLSFLNIVFDEVFPVWAMSTTKQGGLDWQSSTIGQVLCFTGIMMAAFQFILYPIIAKSMGVILMQNVFSMLAIPFFFMIPFASQITAGTVTVRVIVIILLTTNKISNNLLFTSILLMINRAVSKKLRGTVNGITTMISSIARAVGPPVGACIFAYSLSDRAPAFFDYRTTFILCSGLSATFSYCSWKYFHHSKYLSADESDETVAK